MGNVSIHAGLRNQMYVRINFRNRPRFKIVQKLYKIHKNPQIVHSIMRLNNFDVCGSTYFVIHNRNIS